jgi:prolyl oligopeptidase
MEKMKYPATPTVDQTDDYHGTLVSDPYRWLEDLSSPDTKDWIKAQNRLTQSYLVKIPRKEQIRQRLTELWDFPRAYAPLKVKGRYFQLRNSGLQNQDVLYTMDAVEGEKRILLDPNELSEDGTISLTNWEISPDGNLLAYATNTSGSDWQIWRVREIDTGQDLADIIQWNKFASVAWNPDSSGIYYCGYDRPADSETYEGLNLNQKVLFHRLGTDQSQDQLIYARSDQPEWGFDPIVTNDGKYLILEVSQGTDIRNRFFYRELESSDEFIELITDLEASYRFIENDGSEFYIHTNYQAPLGQLIAIDIGNPEKSAWNSIIPEGGDSIESIKLINNQFIIIYLHDAFHLLKRFDILGNFLDEISLPMMGSIFSSDRKNYLFGNRDEDELYMQKDRTTGY